MQLLVLRVSIAGLLALGVAAVSHAQTCADPSRTFFAGDPFTEACRFTEDQQECETAWHIGGRKTPDTSDDFAASCFFSVLDEECLGCGPKNEGMGLCTNTCVAPANGTPIPCTIGFWKNRAQTPEGQAHHFADPEFDQVLGAAALLSSEFANPVELLTALLSQGERTQEEKALQQLAGLLLNLAAGELFPDNQKCELFESNSLGENACVGATTVGAALDRILADLAAEQFEAAKDCADDLNNGNGVLEAASETEDGDAEQGD